jgi:AraC-like DNA-binding protein
MTPPLLRSLPRYHFDSAKDGELTGSPIAHAFKIRGRVRTVTSMLPLPQGAILSGRACGENSFDLEINGAVFVCRFAVGGRSRHEHDGRVVCVGQDLLALPGTRVREQTQDAAVLLLALRQRAVAAAFGGMSPPSVGLMTLDSRRGRQLRELAFAAAHEIEGLSESLRTKYLRNFQNLMAAALAVVLGDFVPHRRTAEPMVGRRQLAELCEWAALERDDPLTVGDLAARCGLGLRALEKNFLRYFDTTPFAYLRDLRLQKARRLLQDPSASCSVTDAALEAGFAHLGRFSAVYREKFGELPSQTLHRMPPRLGSAFSPGAPPRSQYG